MLCCKVNVMTKTRKKKDKQESKQDNRNLTSDASSWPFFNQL